MYHILHYYFLLPRKRTEQNLNLLKSRKCTGVSPRLSATHLPDQFQPPRTKLGTLNWQVQVLLLFSGALRVPRLPVRQICVQGEDPALVLLRRPHARHARARRRLVAHVQQEERPERAVQLQAGLALASTTVVTFAN